MPISPLPTIIDGSGCGGSGCQDFPALCAGPFVFHGLYGQHAQLYGQHAQEFEVACGNGFAKRLNFSVSADDSEQIAVQYIGENHRRCENRNVTTDDAH